MCAADRSRARTSRPAWRHTWDSEPPIVASGSDAWRSYLAIMQFTWAPGLFNFEQKEINSSPEHQLTSGPWGGNDPKTPEGSTKLPSKTDPPSSDPGECAPGQAPGCRSPKQQPHKNERNCKKSARPMAETQRMKGPCPSALARPTK